MARSKRIAPPTMDIYRELNKMLARKPKVRLPGEVRHGNLMFHPHLKVSGHERINTNPFRVRTHPTQSLGVSKLKKII